MTRPLIPLLGLMLALIGCSTSQQTPDTQLVPSLPDGVRFVAQKSAKPGEVTIPYTKYQLDNGLTVILHQDNSDPLVHVDMTYHVGSAREELGKSGFAHFFEHMMFQGSKHVADDEHFKLITEAGGDMNGTTNSDRTNYYQTVPANHLEKVLWLEADRMGFLIEAVSQKKFENQRATVKNERAQNYDNQPYGLRSERTGEALYPVGHPYSWSTIGYVEDLDRVSVQDLKAFFKRWYGPNNAVLTIGGQIDAEQALAWVEKYFGSIPRGPEVTDTQVEPVTLEEDRYLTLEDQVYLPLLQITYPTVRVRHEDEAPLDVLSDILGRGKTSLFYKNLVREQLAVQAVVSHPCRELACEFQLLALANPAKTENLAQLESAVNATLLEFEQRGVNQDDLNRTKASIEASTIFGLQSVSGKVSTLAINEVFDQEPDLVQFDLDRYNTVTKEDVMRVYRKYVKGKARVVLSVVPAGQVAMVAKPANFVPEPRAFSTEVVKTEVAPLNIEDDFDRSVQPPAGSAPAVKVPAFEQHTFANGVRLLAHRTTETPTVSLTFSMEGGPLLDPRDKAGLASVTAQMMNESTLRSSNEELANQLALLGSSISFSAGGRFTQVSVSSLSKNLTQTLAILQEKLFTPAFAVSDFERIMETRLQGAQQQVKNPSVLASRAVGQIMYGDNSRLSVPDGGNLNTLQNITLDDVKDFYGRYYSPKLANMVVVGDFDEQALLAQLTFLTAWQGPDFSIPPLGDETDVEKYLGQPVIYLVDKPGAEQSVLRVFKRAQPYDATGQQFKSKLMNFPLGGMFNSRINLNLREDKGYTYGAFSGFSGGKSLGRFQVSADVKADHTGDSLVEMLKEMRQYRDDGISVEELALMRSAYTQSEALNYETPGSKARFLRHLLVYDLQTDYLEQQGDIIRTISKSEIDALAAKKLDEQSMQIVVVGDASQVKAQLESLGRPIVTFEVTL